MDRRILFTGLAVLFLVTTILALSVNNTKLANAAANVAAAVSKWKAIAISNQDLPRTVPTTSSVQAVFFTGTGIAVNPQDKLDFKYVNVIVGRVLVPSSSVSEDSSTSPDLEVKCTNSTGTGKCFVFVRAGLLYLDKDRYTLRNVDFDDESATATLYGNGTEVGSLSVIKVDKTGRAIWVGTVTVRNLNYYTYILGTNNSLLISSADLQDKVDNIKACGQKLPSVNVTEIANCKKNGGRIYIGRGEDGCPMAPACVTANCTKVTAISVRERIDCISEGGTVVAGVDDEGCPESPKCVLASGETRKVV